MFAVLSTLVIIGGGCGWRADWRSQSQHNVKGALVSSEPVPPSAYAAYMRARIALEQRPPDYASAKRALSLAIRLDTNDPHLWTSLAEVEAAGGDLEAARGSIAYALELAPNYGPARVLSAELLP